MALNIVLTSILVIITAATGAALTIDYKRAKAGKKAVFWEKKERRKD